MGSTSDSYKNDPNSVSQYFQDQNYAPQIQQAQQNFQATQAQQQQLAQALQAQANGEGPNPASSMLQNATNQNNQEAMGMLASQRGLNPALAARLGAETAANNNQQAANQAATLRANQILASQSQLGSLLGTSGSQQLENQNAYLGATSNQNAQVLGQYGSMQGLNADAQKATAQGNAQVVGGIAQGVGTVAGGVLGSGGKVASPTQQIGAAHGGLISGRAEVKGDSPKNDTVPTLLSPGEIVIPRSKTSPDKAKEFIEHLIKHQASKDEPDGYAKVLAAHRALQERVGRLEKGRKK